MQLDIGDPGSVKAWSCLGSSISQKKNDTIRGNSTPLGHTQLQVQLSVPHRTTYGQQGSQIPGGGDHVPVVTTFARNVYLNVGATGTQPPQVMLFIILLIRKGRLRYLRRQVYHPFELCLFE